MQCTFSKQPCLLMVNPPWLMSIELARRHGNRNTLFSDQMRSSGNAYNLDAGNATPAGASFSRHDPNEWAVASTACRPSYDTSLACCCPSSSCPLWPMAAEVALPFFHSRQPYDQLTTTCCRSHAMTLALPAARLKSCACLRRQPQARDPSSATGSAGVAPPPAWASFS
jgi:hypothetical protein